MSTSIDKRLEEVRRHRLTELNAYYDLLIAKFTPAEVEALRGYIAMRRLGRNETEYTSPAILTTVQKYEALGLSDLSKRIGELLTPDERQKQVAEQLAGTKDHLQESGL